MKLLRLLALTALFCVALIASVALGASALSPTQVVDALFRHGDPTARAIVMQLRLPRAALTSLVGGGLALSGSVFQALLRNPLADPYILGVSSGAAVGAVLAVTLGWSLRAPAALPLAAFGGALLAIILVFRIASGVGRALDTRVLLLSGVALGAFFNAIILLVLTFSSVESFRSAIFWMMGSLSGATWGAAGLLALYLVPSSALLIALARPLNLMSVGEETAAYLGVRIERVKIAAYLLASVMVAAAVSLAGAIGFVGLVVPHVLRLLWGSDHRLLLPASLIGGATFLLIADTVARTVAAPAELPVGVVTALVGVPVFVALLTQKARA